MCGMDDVVILTPQGHWRCCGNRVFHSFEPTSEGEQPGMDGTSRGNGIQWEMDVVF